MVSFVCVFSFSNASFDIMVTCNIVFVGQMGVLFLLCLEYYILLAMSRILAVILRAYTPMSLST